MSNSHSYADVTAMVQQLIVEIEASNWEPEIIVGVSRGGLLPAILLSNHFECPMQPLVWSAKNPSGNECNCWLPADAIAGKHTLIVEDIIDTGETIKQIIEDWNSSVHKHIDWDSVVKVACLHKRNATEFMPAYVAHVLDNDDHQVYPWENTNANQ
jgi:hypoxanthine phosphoribosyltransferase